MWIKEEGLEIGVVDSDWKCNLNDCENVVKKGERMVCEGGLIFVCLGCIKEKGRCVMNKCNECKEEISSIRYENVGLCGSCYRKVCVYCEGNGCFECEGCFYCKSKVSDYLYKERNICKDCLCEKDVRYKKLVERMRMKCLIGG